MILHTQNKPLLSSKQSTIYNLQSAIFVLWGGSLGFVAGAALMAELAKRLGWWPPSEKRLERYKGKKI